MVLVLVPVGLCGCSAPRTQCCSQVSTRLFIPGAVSHPSFTPPGRRKVTKLGIFRPRPAAGPTPGWAEPAAACVAPGAGWGGPGPAGRSRPAARQGPSCCPTGASLCPAGASCLLPDGSLLLAVRDLPLPVGPAALPRPAVPRPPAPPFPSPVSKMLPAPGRAQACRG